MNLKKKYTVASLGTVAAGAVVAGAVIIPLNVANAENTHTPTAQSSADAAAEKALAKKQAEAKKRAAAKKSRFAESKRWASTSKARSVINCESSGNYKLHYGSYYGAWQFDRGTWLANGGGKYAPTANLASKAEQDYIAWKTWKARGWQPWACA